MNSNPDNQPPAFAPNPEETVFMGSGFAASRRPGM